MNLKIYLLLFISLLSSSIHAQWTQVGADIQGEAALDEAGYGVSMNGDGSIVAVSAYLNDLGGSNAGQIRVFQLIDDNWVQMGQDIYGENSGDIAREMSLSDNGMRVAVGAQYNDDSGTEAGNVRVYEFTGATWTQLGSDIDGESEFDWSGFSVSLSGDGQRVAVGAQNNDGNGQDAGHARVYEFSDGEWNQLGTDLDGEAAGDLFGHSVSLDYSGHRLAVGGYFNNGEFGQAGHVRVFEYSSASWIQLGADIDGEAPGDFFGYGLDISGDGNRVVVGAFNNDGGGIDAGHARIFEYSDDSWNQIGADIDGEAAVDNSGISVGTNHDGSIVIVGAYRNDGNGFDSGHARIFRYEMGTWVQLGSDIDGTDIINYFGIRVAMNNDGYHFIAGSPPNDDSGNNAGNARVFSHPSPCSSTSNSIPVTACDSYTAPSGDETYTALGTYTVLDTIPNAGGCDSLLTINLTMSNSSTGTDVQTACDFYTWIDGNTYTASTNTPTWILSNSVGCDSLVTLNVAISNSSGGTDVQSACDSFTWIDGNTYTSSNNTATQTLINAAGCDSSVTLDLTINTLSSTVSQDGVILTADENGATYQWLNCPELTPIIGATGQSYTATESGDYAVIVDNIGCSVTSDCMTVIVVGIIENDFGSELSLYPNPTKGDFSIDFGEHSQIVTVTITDLNGKILESKTYTDNQILNLSINESAGIYILRIKSGESKAVIRLVKE